MIFLIYEELSVRRRVLAALSPSLSLAPPPSPSPPSLPFATSDACAL